MAPLLSVLALAAPAPAFAPASKVGSPAPDFTISTFDHRNVSLGDLRGKVVVINYWATWCVPCREELPLLDTMHIKWHDKGLEIYAILTEDSAPKYQLGKLRKALSVPLASRFAGRGYGTLGGVPTNYVIDRGGTIRYAKAGAFDLDTVNAVILPLLNEHPSGS